MSCCPRSQASSTIVVRADVEHLLATFSSQSRSNLDSSESDASSASCFSATSLTCRSQLSMSPMRRSVECRAHAAAAVVAADDDLLHAEDIDGVLEHRQAVEVGVHDDVRDVAVDEQLARSQPDDLVRRDAAVGAADPEVLGRLMLASSVKNPGSRATMSAAQVRFFANSSTRSATAERLPRFVTCTTPIASSPNSPAVHLRLHRHRGLEAVATPSDQNGGGLVEVHVRRRDLADGRRDQRVIARPPSPRSRNCGRGGRQGVRQEAEMSCSRRSR